MALLKTKDRDAAEKLAQAFRTGKIVVFPTDTVYGLGCIPDERLVKKIFEIKKRPPDKPLPLLVADLKKALTLAQFSPEDRKTAAKFWPGATTLVLFAKKRLPPGVCREGKVALRIPNHPFLKRVIRLAGGVIVGTSANLSGEEPAISLSGISKEILTGADIVADGGELSGRPSAVYDFTGDRPVIIRT